MTVQIRASSRVIALLGDPVSHSLSPVFQNAAFRAAAVDAVYVALRAAPAEVPGLIRGIAMSGGGGNVTLPHKELAASSVDRATDAVIRTGACNTYWLEDGRVCGDNTDVTGVSASIRGLLGAGPAGARVLVLGAGGSARAVLASLIDDQAGQITLSNRSAERARALVAAVPGATDRVRIVGSPAELTAESFDLAVNATSLGLRATDPLPLPPEAGPTVRAALDLVYSRDSTPWVRALSAREIPASDGLEMLLHQGAASFERWWGIPAPVDAMRAALSMTAAPAR